VSNDPAEQHPSAQSVSHNSGRQLADVLGTIALLVAHFVFFTATRRARLALDGQWRDGVARHVNLAGTGDRQWQQLSGRKVEDQLVVGDSEVLVVR